MAYSQKIIFSSDILKITIYQDLRSVGFQFRSNTPQIWQKIGKPKIVKELHLDEFTNYLEDCKNGPIKKVSKEAIKLLKKFPEIFK
jgi:hypothetical protein